MPPESVGATKKPRFFYGWIIVLVGFLGDFMVAGVTVHSFGFILKPMSQELGWTRTMTMGAASLRTIMGAFSSLIIGPILDRWGPRPVMVLGGLIGGIGIIALSRVNQLWQFYVVYGVIGAIGIIAMGGFVTSTIVSKWFIRKRGRATAIVTAGLPIGGAVLGPITQYVILNYDWQTAWVVLGVLIWVVIIPLAWIFMRRTPEDMGLRPDGDEVSPESRTSGDPSEHSTTTEETWTLRAALRTPSLWLIVLAFILSGMGLSASIYHQTPYISDKGLPPSVMATNLVLFGIAAAIGSLFWGFLAERVPVRFCVVATFLASAGGLVILITAQSPPAILTYAVAYGFAAGGFAPLEAITTANYYGRTFLGTIRGAMMPLRLTSMAGAPLFAAYIYDVTGSYDLAFTIFAGTYLLGAFVIFLARPPKARTAP